MLTSGHEYGVGSFLLDSLAKERMGVQTESIICTEDFEK